MSKITTIEELKNKYPEACAKVELEEIKKENKINEDAKLIAKCMNGEVE